MVFTSCSFCVLFGDHGDQLMSDDHRKVKTIPFSYKRLYLIPECRGEREHFKAPCLEVNIQTIKLNSIEL